MVPKERTSYPLRQFQLNHYFEQPLGTLHSLPSSNGSEVYFAFPKSATEFHYILF
jgi:hypothetical protein